MTHEILLNMIDVFFSNAYSMLQFIYLVKKESRL